MTHDGIGINYEWFNAQNYSLSLSVVVEHFEFNDFGSSELKRIMARVSSSVLRVWLQIRGACLQFNYVNFDYVILFNGCFINYWSVILYYLGENICFISYFHTGLSEPFLWLFFTLFFLSPFDSINNYAAGN